jgi:hypothetical protein
LGFLETVRVGSVDCRVARELRSWFGFGYVLSLKRERGVGRYSSRGEESLFISDRRPRKRETGRWQDNQSRNARAGFV